MPRGHGHVLTDESLVHNVHFLPLGAMLPPPLPQTKIITQLAAPRLEAEDVVPKLVQC